MKRRLLKQLHIGEQTRVSFSRIEGFRELEVEVTALIYSKKNLLSSFYPFFYINKIKQSTSK